MRHKRIQSNIKSLERQVRDLQQHVQSLEAQQRTLSVQHHILSCCCEVLHWLRTGNVHAGWMECKDTWMPDEVLLLRDLVVHLDDRSAQLLDQLDAQPKAQQTSTAQQGQQQQYQEQEQHAGEDLPSVPSSRESSSFFFAAGPAAGVAAASTAAGAQEREGPAAAAEAAGQLPVTQPSLYLTSPRDCLGGMKHSLSQPPAEGAAEWTLQQFVNYYTALVKELALLVVLAEQQSCDHGVPFDGSTLHPLQALQQLTLRHTHVINTILLLHTDDLLNKVRVVNLSTLELDDEPEQAWKRMCRISKALDLSEEQQQTVVAGAELFKRLLDHVRSERHALSAQQGQQVDMRLATGRSVDLQGQEASATRLHLVIKKENFLLTCASMFIANVLTVVQLAKVAVLAWPYAPHLGMLGPALMAQRGAAA